MEAERVLGAQTMNCGVWSLRDEVRETATKKGNENQGKVCSRGETCTRPNVDRGHERKETKGKMLKDEAPKGDRKDEAKGP